MSRTVDRAPRLRRIPLVLALSGAVLLPLAAAAPPESDKTRAGTVESRVTLPASGKLEPVPLETQVDQLRSMVTKLQQEVQRLNGRTMQQGSAGVALQERVDRLEDAVEVSQDGIRIRTTGNLLVESAGPLTLKASAAHLRSPMLNVHGVTRSNQVIAKTVVAETYTPGAGNIW